jgi:glutamine amidotransferase
VTIVIVDYEVGNFRNVQRAFEKINTDTIISSDPDVISNAPAIVLPGVGAFRTAMDNIERLKLDSVLSCRAAAGAPILGICLGMQLLAQSSTEGGGVRKGLGLLPMKVEQLSVENTDLRLPHIGWNNISVAPKSRLFQEIEILDPDFYFVHSYRVIPTDSSIVSAVCSYGGDFVCATEWGSIFAVQFHPEKSQQYGREVLKAFAKISQISGSA